ncbi:hypothetical protein [Actinomadura flavalba]|uniref:hypothetical protein n=1 Tax=Actinomadura flavalba TaxID=1120938 RepID=UPI000378F57D|nr:hypothetical protein [Actinomadura flavalba]
MNRGFLLPLLAGALLTVPLAVPANAAAPAWVRAELTELAPSAFSDVRATPVPAHRWEPFAVSARLTRTVDGKAVPVQDGHADLQYFDLDGGAWTTVCVAEVRDGAVRCERTADRPGYWRYRYAGTWETAPAVSTPQFVDVRVRTSFAGTTSPAQLRRGERATFTGHLYRMTEKQMAEPAGKGAKIVLEFQPTGSTAWTAVATTTTTADRGRYSVTTTAQRTGLWRTRYAGSTTYLGASSRAHAVKVGSRTGFTSAFNAAPEPVRKGRPITVSGRLLRGTEEGWASASGAAVQIQFRAAGSSVWTTLGSVKTAKKGTFSRSFTAVKDGAWRAVYAGSVTYFASSSKADYVDVR